MKSSICLIITSFVINAWAQTELPKYDWKATLKVVDERGQPVEGAETRVYYGQTNKFSGQSDANGIFVASHHDSVENLAFEADKAGYYPFRMRYHLGRNYKPDKWNPAQTILLKRIIKPIPMYAKALNTHIPTLDKPVSYDLMAGDWVAPYGKGINTDIIFTGHIDKPTPDESNYKLTVSFPNKMDGIQEFSVPSYYLHSQGSALRSAQEAPTDDYQPEWIQTDNRKAGRPVRTNRDLNRNYYFRVRTVLDGQGKLNSAFYGKIYGDFMHFSYYLNPTPNSRNIEFDPKQNLMKSLKEMEVVKDP